MAITHCAVEGCKSITQRYPASRKIPWVCSYCRRKSDKRLQAIRRYAPKIKRQIIKERGLKCEDCGIKVNRPGELAAHHIVAAAHGGQTTPDNLILLCKPCHKATHKNGPAVIWTAHELLNKAGNNGR
jgi:5-methylcytosine-specific restriction endonuclease McrA